MYTVRGLIRFCAACEAYIDDGDAAVLIAKVRLKEGRIWYSGSIDTFHASCWERMNPQTSLTEIPSAKTTPPPS